MPPAPDSRLLLNSLRRLIAYRPGKLASNTIIGTFWQFVRLGGQTASIIIVARALGPGGYGMLTGFGGSAIALSGLVWLGSAYLMLQAVTHDHTSFGRHWSATLDSVVWIGAMLTTIYLVTAPPLLRMHLPVLPLLSIGLSEMLFYPVVYVSSFAFQAHEKLGWANGLQAMMALTRLAGAGAFLRSGTLTFEHYTYFHCSASLTAATLALLIVQRQLRPPRSYRARYSWVEIRSGLRFAINGITTNAYGEMDKLMAVRYLGATSAGTYALASRLTNILTIPVMSLAQAAQPRLFRQVQSGNLRSMRRLLFAIASTSLLYAGFAIFMVFLIAPLLPLLLGSGFVATTDTVKLLSPLILLLSLKLVTATLLMALNQTIAKASLELLATGAIFAASILLVPRYGVGGLVSSVVMVEVLLLAALAGTAARTISRLQKYPRADTLRSRPDEPANGGTKGAAKAFKP